MADEVNIKMIEAQKAALEKQQAQQWADVSIGYEQHDDVFGLKDANGNKITQFEGKTIYWKRTEEEGKEIYTSTSRAKRIGLIPCMNGDVIAPGSKTNGWGEVKAVKDNGETYVAMWRPIEFQQKQRRMQTEMRDSSLTVQGLTNSMTRSGHVAPPAPIYNDSKMIVRSGR